MKKEVIKIIASITDIPIKKIKEDTNLLTDLDLESLDLATLVSELEKEYEIEIPDKEIKKFQTVGDILNYLGNHV